jgi:uncharacterized protein YndB with AHSA1/START domain
MSMIQTSRPRAVADLAQGLILASVEIAAPPERVFSALASKEIVDWWVNPGVFNTTEWSGDVRVGGHWRSSGLVRGERYSLEGEFVEVDPPRKLVHTWQRVGAPGGKTTVTYLLEPLEGGTRVTLRHAGFPSHGAFMTTSMGWETSLERLAQILGGEPV